VHPKVPGDFEALYDGTYYLIECKSTHQDRFVCEHLREHQRDALRRVSNAGGVGVILISFRRRRPVNCCAVDINDYLNLEASVMGKRKSIPRKDVEGVALMLDRIPRQGWNLKPIFEAWR